MLLEKPVAALRARGRYAVVLWAEIVLFSGFMSADMVCLGSGAVGDEDIYFLLCFGFRRDSQAKQ